MKKKVKGPALRFAIGRATRHLPEEDKPGSQEETAERLRHDRICRRQTCAGTIASRTDGAESECRSQSGGRHGRDAHRASFARALAVAPHPGEHERNRVGL